MSKRQNGEGTIYQRSDGLWIAEITLGYKEEGKRIKKHLSSKNLDELKKKLNDNRYFNDRSMVGKRLSISEGLSNNDNGAGKFGAVCYYIIYSVLMSFFLTTV